MPPVVIRPSRPVTHNLSFQLYALDKKLNAEEELNHLKGLNQVFPAVFRTDGTPLYKLMARPDSVAAFFSTLSGSVTAALTHLAISFDHGGFHPTALLAGLGAGALGGAYGYVKQAQINENIQDFIRLTPVRNPSIRVLKMDVANLLAVAKKQPLAKEAIQNLSRLV